MAKKKKASTWGVVCSTLEKEPLVDPERRDVVEAVKQQILSEANDTEKIDVDEALDVLHDEIIELLTSIKYASAGVRKASTFAKRIAELKKVKERMAEWDSMRNLVYEAYLALMIEEFEKEEIDAVRLDNGQLISTWDEPYFSVKDPALLRAWCIKNGLASKLSLHPGTLASHGKDLLEAGQPPPDGVKVTSITKVRIGSEKG